MRHTISSKFAPLALLVLLAAGGCSELPTGPSAGELNQSLEVFSAPIDPGGAINFPFPLGEPATVQLMYAGATLNNPVRSIQPTLTVSIGRLTDTVCDPIQTVQTAPRLTAALQLFLPVGSYCALVSDAGSLTEPAAVTIRIVSPALLRTGGSPGSAIFQSTVTPSGSSTRTFDASVQGEVTISLDSLSTAGPAGVGLGILDPNGTGCRIVRVIHAVAGVTPPLTATVDAGPYCAGIFDIGNFTKNETFSMKIEYP